MENDERCTIIIDSSGSEAILVGLEIGDGKQYERKRPVSQAKAQEVLPMIEELLIKQSLTLDDITAIRVNTGPGSYTGLRVGIAIANMLGALLWVPINGLSVGQHVFPVYESDRYKS